MTRVCHVCSVQLTEYIGIGRPARYCGSSHCKRIGFLADSLVFAAHAAAEDGEGRAVFGFFSRLPAAIDAALDVRDPD